MRFASAVTALAVTGASALKCRDTDPKVNGQYIPAKAPRENIFAGITKDEGNDIRKFLDRESGVSMCVFTHSPFTQTNGLADLTCLP
jgi:hypothetical protein